MCVPEIGITLLYILIKLRIVFVASGFTFGENELHLLQTNNKVQILSCQTIVESPFRCHHIFKITPVGVNRRHHWTFGCKTKLSPQAKNPLRRQTFLHCFQQFP
jgi:hypothetical protein